MKNRLFSLYSPTDDLMGVKVRVWHPAWFIPMWKFKVGYWIGVWKREAIYREALNDISSSFVESGDIEFRELIAHIMDNVDCGYECAYVGTVGFVPEDGCPIHDYP